jgi:hypothetical protein
MVGIIQKICAKPETEKNIITSRVINLKNIGTKTMCKMPAIKVDAAAT